MRSAPPTGTRPGNRSAGPSETTQWTQGPCADPIPPKPDTWIKTQQTTSPSVLQKLFSNDFYKYLNLFFSPFRQKKKNVNSFENSR